MRTLLVSYTTTDRAAGENAGLVRAVFDELARTDPGGLRYAAFRLADGVRFLHVAQIADPEANPLMSSPAFAVFQADLPSRCAIPPSPSAATLIGSHRFLTP